MTKQIHLNFLINGTDFDSTFLVVKGLSLDIILGDDFLQRNRAVINFKEQVIELDGGDRSVRVNFERVIDKSRTQGVKLLKKRVDEENSDTRINGCREVEYIDEEDNDARDVSDAVWEIRADKFRSEGYDVGSGQRAALWQVIERYRGVFADVPGRAKNYECVLQIREHTPFMQRSYPDVYKRQM